MAINVVSFCFQVGSVLSKLAAVMVGEGLAGSRRNSQHMLDLLDVVVRVIIVLHWDGIVPNIKSDCTSPLVIVLSKENVICPRERLLSSCKTAH